MSKITSIDIQLFHVPLAEILSDAKHGDHTHFELITATIKLDDGSHGTGIQPPRNASHDARNAIHASRHDATGL